MEDCIICGKSLRDVSADQQQAHLNSCLDRQSKSKRKKRKSTHDITNDNLSSLSTTNNVHSKQFSCVLCSKNLNKLSLENRLKHLRKCSESNGVNRNVLAEMIVREPEQPQSVTAAEKDKENQDKGGVGKLVWEKTTSTVSKRRQLNDSKGTKKQKGDSEKKSNLTDMTVSEYFKAELPKVKPRPRVASRNHKHASRSRNRSQVLSGSIESSKASSAEEQACTIRKQVVQIDQEVAQLQRRRSDLVTRLQSLSAILSPPSVSAANAAQASLAKPELGDTHPNPSNSPSSDPLRPLLWSLAAIEFGHQGPAGPGPENVSDNSRVFACDVFASVLTSPSPSSLLKPSVPPRPPVSPVTLHKQIAAHLAKQRRLAAVPLPQAIPLESLSHEPLEHALPSIGSGTVNDLLSPGESSSASDECVNSLVPSMQSSSSLPSTLASLSPSPSSAPVFSVVASSPVESAHTCVAAETSALRRMSGEEFCGLSAFTQLPSPPASTPVRLPSAVEFEQMSPAARRFNSLLDLLESPRPLSARKHTRVSPKETGEELDLIIDEPDGEVSPQLSKPVNRRSSVGGLEPGFEPPESPSPQRLSLDCSLSPVFDRARDPVESNGRESPDFGCAASAGVGVDSRTQELANRTTSLLPATRNAAAIRVDSDLEMEPDCKTTSESDENAQSGCEMQIDNHSSRDFSSLSHEDLTALMASYGLKQKSRKQMIKRLLEIQMLRNHQEPEAPRSGHDSGIESHRSLEPVGPDDIESQISRFVLSCPELHIQILLMETIELSQVLRLLKDGDVLCSKKQLMAFFDRQGIAFAQPWK